MHRKSYFKIAADLRRSRGSHLWDNRSNRSYLDFFGLYAANALGYNHPIFSKPSFQDELQSIAGVEIPLNEIITDIGDRYLESFTRYSKRHGFEHIHFTCTGSLAIESAIKAAIDHKGVQDPVVISFKNSFHGINGYAGFVTDHFVPAKERLEGFLNFDWPKIDASALNGPDKKGLESKVGLERLAEDFAQAIAKYQDRVIAVVVEPIQSTAGDLYFPQAFFEQVRSLCDANAILWIQDEIQSGAGVTGTFWQSEQNPSWPDIIVFGKKIQAGIMARSHVREIFDRPVRLEVTFDGTLHNILRSTYILKAIEDEGLLDNALKRGNKLRQSLATIDGLEGVRGVGLLAAFDLASPELRDGFVGNCFARGLLVSRAGRRSVRLRPNLAVTGEDIAVACEVIANSAAELSRHGY